MEGSASYPVWYSRRLVLGFFTLLCCMVYWLYCSLESGGFGISLLLLWDGVFLSSWG